MHPSKKIFFTSNTALCIVRFPCLWLFLHYVFFSFLTRAHMTSAEILSFLGCIVFVGMCERVIKVRLLGKISELIICL